MQASCNGQCAGLGLTEAAVDVVAEMQSFHTPPTTLMLPGFKRCIPSVVQVIKLHEFVQLGRCQDDGLQLPALRTMLHTWAVAVAGTLHRQLCVGRDCWDKPAVLIFELSN